MNLVLRAIQDLSHYHLLDPAMNEHLGHSARESRLVLDGKIIPLLWIDMSMWAGS